MWAIIGTLITSLLPMLIKLVLFIIDKKQDNDQMRIEMLKLIANIEKDMPIKIHDKYQEQLDRIRADIDKLKAGPIQ